jgi:hypothetical protein
MCPTQLPAQEVDRIWGRVHTVSGDVLEGFIRWDRNEGSWADLLDGTKKVEPFRFQDWWDLAHPGNRTRERVIEVAGYRVTWDDDEPDFASNRESGVRFGHIESLTPAGDDGITLVLRSGKSVELEGGSTDIGSDLREILVTDQRGRVTELEWEDLDRVDLDAAPQDWRAENRRLYGTVKVQDGPSFTGYIAWDSDASFTSDTLEGVGPRPRRPGVLLEGTAAIRHSGDGGRILYSDGSQVELSKSEVMNWGNPGIEVSDPGLGIIEVNWDDIEELRFHPPESPTGRDAFDGGRRLRGTVVTADSTELTGWIRWDADEEYSWEILDGRDGGMNFDVEFSRIASIERMVEVTVGITIGATGGEVDRSRREGVRVTLLDGRVLELDGSNDVTEDNDGIFVLEEGSGISPDDEAAEWTLVRWKDFRAIRFVGEDGP